MSDEFLNALADDLEPRAPLCDRKLWALGAVVLAASVALVLSVMGLRADYEDAWQSGALLWKPGIFLLIWLGSLLMIGDLSRPDGRVRLWHGALLAAAGLMLIWQLVVQPFTHAVPDVATGMRDGSAFLCLSVIGGLGAFFVLPFWLVWLRKTASPRPILLGFLAGLNTASLAAASYALYCSKDSIFYVFAFYGFPLIGLGFAAAFTLSRSLRW